MTRVENGNPFGRLSEESLVEFERSLSGKLPDEYRKFLLSYNGGTLSPDGFEIGGGLGGSRVHCVLGLHQGPQWARLQDKLSNFKERIPVGTIPIAADPGGNLILLYYSGERRGQIVFWEHDAAWEGEDSGEALVVLAESFLDFLNKLKLPAPLVSNDAFSLVVENGDIVALRKLVAEGLPLTSEDEYGRSLARIAAMNNHLDILRYLKESGAPLHGALAAAAANGYGNMCQYLLESGTPPDERRREEEGTPLVLAASGGYIDVVKLLLGRGADVNATDSQKRTAMQFAKWGDHKAVVELLQKAQRNQNP